jgi:hypothetical protein
MARAAGLTLNVQDTVGSAIAFAAITHLGATVPRQLLRHVLNCEDMVSLGTAKFDVVREDAGILPSTTQARGCLSTRMSLVHRWRHGATSMPHLFGRNNRSTVVLARQPGGPEVLQSAGGAAGSMNGRTLDQGGRWGC